MTTPPETEPTPYERADAAGRTVAEAIQRFKYVFAAEKDLQERISAALTTGGIEHLREHNLTPRDRVDLMAGRVAVELKVAGDPGSVRRQLTRYADSDEVDALVLVTTRARHRNLSPTLNGKPLFVVWLSASYLSGGGR